MFKDIETYRLKLRTLTLEDADAIFNYRKDKSNFPHVEMNEYSSIDEAKTYINKVNSFDEWKVYGVALIESNQIIGTLSVWNFNDDRTKAEIGYGLFKEFRGQSFMTEAIEGLTKYLFNEHYLSSIEAYTSTTNQSSNELLKRCKFKYVDTVEENSPANNQPTIMNIYELTKGE
jgi:ribosomal-protein-alanine N-acetyltransferase